MPSRSYEKIKKLLASPEPVEAQNGLDMARQQMYTGGQATALELAEIVSSLFYVDPLDQPQFVPIIDDAVELVASLGEAVLPLMLEIMDAGDMKAQIVCGHALGRIGPKAIQPLIREYKASPNPTRRALILYALGKIRSAELIQAAQLVLEAAESSDPELRDTATRALGKFAEAVPPHAVSAPLRRAVLERLEAEITDPNPSLRAKAVRSLGKFARFGYLLPPERERFKTICRSILGSDEKQTWDRAYIVRKEAGEALRYC